MIQPELHPQPQFTRERWLDLNGKWGFAYDDDNIGIAQDWVHRSDPFAATILVPFPPESGASGIGDTGMHSVVWYRRTITIPAEWGDQQIMLHFGAVDYRAQVWVNGGLVVSHEGGHTPFSADITSALRTNESGGDHVLVVRAEDIPTDTEQPRGKQYWEAQPRDIFYTRTTGIWQPVWLEPVSALHIDSIVWTPDIDAGQVGVRVRLNYEPTQPVSLHIRLTLHDVTLVDDTYTMPLEAIQRSLSLEATRSLNWRQVIWTPDYPNLIDAVITLKEGDTIIDQVGSYFGLRTVGVGNGFFLLNGGPIYLRLVLGQNYWDDTNLTPPSPDAFHDEVRLIKRLGFNGVRIHQKVEDPRFLYWCDRLGVMVWGEMANAFSFSPEAVARLTREWIDVVARDVNHPCIICWVPLNESWGVPNLARDPAQQSYVQALYHLTKALDPTRPVIGNDGWEHIVTDVWGIHDYATDGESLRDRYSTPDSVSQTLQLRQPQFRVLMLPGASRSDEPIMLTECGGIAFMPDPGKPWFGYGTVTDTDSLLAKYKELLDAILDSPTIAGFCYTQLTDVQQEANGLLTADRTPKMDIDAVYSITRRPSKALPGELLTYIHQAADAITGTANVGENKT